MSNPFYFVLSIMFMIFAFQIVKHKLGMTDRLHRRNAWEPPKEDSAETLRLREEVLERVGGEPARLQRDIAHTHAPPGC